MNRSVFVLAGVGVRGRRRAGIVSIFAVLMFAAIAMAAGLVVSTQGAPLLDTAARRANVAHLVLFGTPQAIESVATDPEVVAWAGPFATLADLSLRVGSQDVAMRVTALDTPRIAVHRPLMSRGRWARGTGEIVLDRSLAFDLGLRPGDRATFERKGTRTAFTVVGTAIDLSDCFYPQCDPGRAWVTEGGFARFHASGDGAFAQGWLRFADASRADAFVERHAAAGASGISGTESWLDTRSDFLSLDRIFGSFVTAFGVFVLAVAAVVVAGSMAIRIVARRREVGLLGAVGCTPRQITAGLVVENLGVGAIAAIVGWFLAGFLAPSLQLGIGRTLGPQHPNWSAIGLLVCVVVISVILLVATIVPAVAAARHPVTDVLRDVPKARVSFLNRRASGVPHRLSFLGVSDAASHPTRSALAALAIAVAIVGTVVSIGFIGALGRVSADPARAGDPWDVAFGAGTLVPSEIEAALHDTAGVDHWFSEVERRSTFHEGAFLSVATGGAPSDARYQIASGRTMLRAGEGIAGYGFLRRFDVAVGDEVKFLAGTAPLSVRIVGWYRDTEDSGEILRYRMETLAAAEPGLKPDLYRIAASKGVPPVRLASALSARLGPSVRVEVLDTGVEDLSVLANALRLIAFVLLVMAGTNLLSTLITASHESASRIGVQLAIGFTPKQVRREGALAGAASGVLAAVIGVPLGLWIFRTLSDVVSSDIGVGPGWMPAPGALQTLILVVISLVASAALGSLAVSRVARRSPSDLVRGE